MSCRQAAHTVNTSRNSRRCTYCWHIFEIIRWIMFFWARSQNCEKRLLSSLCLFLSVRLEHSSPTEGVFIKYDNWLFFESPRRWCQFVTRITGTYLKTCVCVCVCVCVWIIPRMRNISHQNYSENWNTEATHGNIMLCEKIRFAYRISKLRIHNHNIFNIYCFLTD